MSQAVIELSIPLQYLEADAGAEINSTECPICTQAVCLSDTCSLSSTTLSCCDQTLCCACFVKILDRCRCTDDCEAVVGTCPYCRTMCRADTVSVFLARRPPCRRCRSK